MKRVADPSSLADRLASLSEPTRLRIIRLLEREELSVGELAKVLQLPQSTVSRHLKVLADAGWLLKRSEGTATLYRLVLDDLPIDLRALWMTVREQLGTTPDDRGELAEDVRRLAAVLDERRLDSQSFFGRVAGQWDAVRGELFGERFAPIALLALLSEDAVIADLGCGTGNASELLSPFVRQVIAVDQSPEMLAAARKRLATRDNVELVQGSLESIPLMAASVDAAVMTLVLHHISEPMLALREARRTLKPDGTLLVIDMVAHDRENYKHTMGHRWLGFSEAHMRALLVEAGFAQQRTRYQTLPPDPAARGPGLFVATARAEAFTR